MHYYRDRLTRSIYSDRELVEMTRSAEIGPRELLARYEELPEAKRRVLEEPEVAAAERRRERHLRRSPKPPAGRPRFSLPGFHRGSE